MINVLHDIIINKFQLITFSSLKTIELIHYVNYIHANMQQASEHLISHKLTTSLHV